MSSRNSDIQYGLLVATNISGIRQYNSYQATDTGSIFKMTPYCHMINPQDVIKFERLLIIEMTGQSSMTKDSYNLEEIVSFYHKRKEHNIKTIISMSWITENILSPPIADIIKHLITQEVNPKHIILFCPENFNEQIYGFDKISPIINVIRCYHAEIHAYYRSYISQEQPLSKFSRDRPNICLVNMAKFYKQLRIALLYEIFKGGQQDQFSVSVNTKNFLSIDDIFSKSLTEVFGNFNFDAQFLSVPGYLKDNEFKEWVKIQEGMIDKFDSIEWDNDILETARYSMLGYPVDPKIFDNACLSLVCETWTTGDFITEKTIKPIINSHPFIINSGHDALKTLHSLGYKTFDFIIDESYDSIEDHELRIKELYKQSLVFLEQYKNHLDQLERVVEHNKLNHYRRGFEKFNEIRQTLIKISNNFSNDAHNPSLS